MGLVFIILFVQYSQSDLPPLRPLCGEAPGRDSKPGRADLVAGTLYTRPKHLIKTTTPHQDHRTSPRPPHLTSPHHQQNLTNVENSAIHFSYFLGLIYNLRPYLGNIFLFRFLQNFTFTLIDSSYTRIKYWQTNIAYTRIEYWQTNIVHI